MLNSFFTFATFAQPHIYMHNLYIIALAEIVGRQRYEIVVNLGDFWQQKQVIYQENCPCFWASKTGWLSHDLINSFKPKVVRFFLTVSLNLVGPQDFLHCEKF